MNAILIERQFYGSRLHFLSVDSNTPLTSSKLCPTCDTVLSPLTVLTTHKKSSPRILIGVCEHCGYLGYMNRPTDEWIVEFYNNTWDQEHKRSKEHVISNVNLKTTGVKSSRHLAFKLLENIQKVDTSRPFCEIGAGYGEILKNAQNFGFTKVIGIEHSKHRAEFINSQLGLPAIHADFCNQELPQEIVEAKPHVLFSHHVFEHVRDPNQFIANCARIQNEGDYFILGLPNSEGEHILYGLLYLPHIHGFSRYSIEKLLNKHGYEVIADNSPDTTNTLILAQKKKSPVSHTKPHKNILHTLNQRIEQAFHAKKITQDTSTLISWRQRDHNVDVSKIVTTQKNGMLNRLSTHIRDLLAYIKSQKLHRFEADYKILVRKASRITPPNIARYEIQFPEKVTLYIK